VWRSETRWWSRISPDLRRLGYFVAVAEERNFTRAAERLHIAQPALSRQVRLLEDELGVELLRRTTHDVELTEAGALLLERGSRLLGEADALWRGVRRLAAGEIGTFRLAYGASSGYETAPKLLAALAERLPELVVETQVLATPAILAGVADGSLDAGIVRCAPSGQVLRREPQGVLLHPDHRLAAREAVGVDDLRDELILIHPRAENPGHYDALLALLDFTPRLLERRVTFDLALTPVAEGRGVMIAGVSARSPGLVWRPLAPELTLDVHLLADDRFASAALGVARELGWV
jgi:DNA-binding transcriptional LysR family regulator